MVRGGHLLRVDLKVTTNQAQMDIGQSTVSRGNFAKVLTVSLSPATDIGRRRDCAFDSCSRRHLQLHNI